MPLLPGQRLGPYEIVSPIGAGGMGEVYRARDARLAREVAIKVLPGEAAANTERLKRFEKEARAASALNHPNIVTVFDAGTSDGTSWIAMELVDGETLRKLLAEPIPLKRLLAIATQVAEGLAKAHATGIVHRDLKPENVMVTKDGTVKILDFGLAKLIEPSPGSGALTHAPTLSQGTAAGVVVGTVEYMSPEQARGLALDFRTDLFSFGSMLYEMASGRRAFSRGSGPETMTAIIREEPEPLASAAPATPAPLRWIVERCLAKDPEERYAATKDLARDLARLREGLAETSLTGGQPAAPAPRGGRWRPLALAAATLAALAAIGVVAMRRPRAGPPTYRPLTFHRGAIGGARFDSDGKTILYSAAWEGKPPQLFSTRLDSTESLALPFPSADLLSLSDSGKLAVRVLHGEEPSAIAEVPRGGGAPKELVASEPLGEDGLGLAAQLADWSPGEDRLAIVRKGQLEFPVGTVLVPASEGAWVLALRFSPDGRRIAFVAVDSRAETGAFEVGVVDRSGTRRVLSTGWEIVASLAWHPGTEELWFSARKGNSDIGVVELYAASLSGTDRLVAQTPQLLIVEDVARDGRVLARSDDWSETLMCQPPGASRELNLTYFDFSRGLALSADGQDVLFMEGGAAGGATGGVYLRKTDGATAAVRLSEGWNQNHYLSPDKTWVVRTLPDRLTLLPVGPGEPKTIQDKDLQYHRALWFTDGKRLLVSASAKGHGPRMYVQELSGGSPRPVTPEGVAAGQVSPDGTLVAAAEMKTEKWALYPVGGGDARPIPGSYGQRLPPGTSRHEEVLGFDASGTGLYVVSGVLTKRIDRLDLATGKRSSLREIAPADPAGVDSIASLLLTPDGRGYCYSVMRSLSRLYLVEGLR